jgi:hypothetical protein
MKKTIISLAILTSMNINAQQPLFEVESYNTPMALKSHQQSQTLLSTTQFSVSISTNSLDIPLMGDMVTFEKQSASLSNSGNLIWIGNNQNGDSVTLVQSIKGVTGTIRFENSLFKLAPTNENNHTITEINEKNIPDEHQAGFSETVQSNPVALNFNGVIDNNLAMSSALATSDIKLLVVYTSTAKSKVADINSLIDLAITETNTGYSNSGINANVSLVHKAQVSYTEASDSSTDLTRLAATNDGYMDEVHTLRDQYAADVVVLVNDVNGYCGQADAIGANAASAFVIVDYDCATGYYSFGHEIGHLQGARHNPENDPTTTPYSFGHGYQDPQSRWRSVMAYNCNSGCTRINYWSNPNKTYNGDVMGTTSKSDNARALNLTSPAMANFRTGVVVPPAVTALENNQGTSINGTKGSETLFSFSVPAGASNIAISTSGGTGDADIYVKRGSTASTGNYDCRPYETGNVENCPLTQSGEYSIMVSGYAAYSNVNLIGSYQLGGTSLPIVISETNLSDVKSGWKYFTVEAPENATSIKAILSGGTGDADIYIRKGAQPTTNSYDCRSWNTGNGESCEKSITAKSTWYVGINAYAAYSAANLEITVK